MRLGELWRALAAIYESFRSCGVLISECLHQSETVSLKRQLADVGYLLCERCGRTTVLVIKAGGNNVLASCV